MAGSKRNRQESVVIIRRKRQGQGHNAPHGGWKVAYADFVTAMMAFFLLMWLVAATSEEEKEALSAYFNPYKADSADAPIEVSAGIISIYDAGMLAGENVHDRELQDSQGDVADLNLKDEDKSAGNSDYTSVFLEISRIEIDRETYDGLLEKASLAEELQFKLDSLEEEGYLDPEFLAPTALDEDIMQVWEKVTRLLETKPELQGLSKNMVIEETPEGLQIQIIEQDEFSMFKSGSAKLLPAAENLLLETGNILKDVKFPISIVGHTDARQFADTSKYSNWELSSDRANAARRILNKAGVEMKQFYRVEGKADTDLLLPEQPFDERNRRISIMVLKHTFGTE